MDGWVVLIACWAALSIGFLAGAWWQSIMTPPSEQDESDSYF